MNPQAGPYGPFTVDLSNPYLNQYHPGNALAYSATITIESPSKGPYTVGDFMPTVRKFDIMTETPDRPKAK